MDLNLEKKSLIQWLTSINDISIINQIKMLKSEHEKVFLTEEEKKAIDKGLASIQSGKVLSDESVKKHTREKFPHLFNKKK